MSTSDTIAKPAAAEPLKGFRKVNEQIYVRDSEPGSRASHEKDPDVIVIFAWGDSRPKHIAKFVDGYLKLYPAAKVVVVLGPILPALYEFLEQRSKRMTPVVEEVFGPQRASDASPDRILLHVMSNTGGINFAAAMDAYTSMKPPFETRQMPATLIVYDSCPGSSHFFRNVTPWSRAMAIGTANFFPWPFVVTQALAAAFITAVHARSWLTGTPTAAEFSVGAANDEELAAKSTPRLYLYSKADSIISYQDIEEHAADARQKGYKVATEVFEGTDHVGHMRVHPEQYWEAIRTEWQATHD